MSRTPMFDPMTSDARSSLIAGLTEACNKIAGILDMKTNTAENISLPELYIEPTDRYRIYQAPLGNKLWLHEPAPVIKKNGTVIEPETDGFSIDYLGGSIAFESGYTLNEWDVITADVTYIVDESNKINDLVASIKSFEEDAGKNKGAFENPDDLSSSFPEAKPGDFAIVTSENAIYIWDDTKKEWVNANAKVDLTEYFTKEEMEQLLNEKQDNIVAKEVDSESGESATDYFYAGDKTWVNLLSKIKGCALSGLVTSDSSQVEAADTLLVAIGKLQAQINGFIHPIIGTGAPTNSTVGVVGQDYINASNGDKYRMISISSSGASKSYIWNKYGTTNVENFKILVPASAWSNNTCAISNRKIQIGKNYTYFVGPSDESYSTYNKCSVRAYDVTTEGILTLQASEMPVVDIYVDICKLDSDHGGDGYNLIYGPSEIVSVEIENTNIDLQPVSKISAENTSGFDSISVKQYGKNLLDSDTFISEYLQTSYAELDGFIMLLPLVPGRTYYIKSNMEGIPGLIENLPPSGVMIRFRFKNSETGELNDPKIVYYIINRHSQGFQEKVSAGFTFSIPDGADLAYLQGFVTTAESQEVVPPILKTLFLYDITDSTTPHMDFEPYAGATLTQNLPETVYGGSYDWSKGELRVTHGLSEEGTVEALPNPKILKLNSQKLHPLLGTNTLMSNCGDTTVKLAASNGKVYNVGGGGGSSKDAVTVSGGGHMTMEDIFGPPPYEIEFTSEELEDTTAKDIIFDGTISGLDSSNVQDAIDNLNSGKQNKLTGAPGQVVGFGSDGAAVAVSGWSNQNILDNAYWANRESIINQPGQEEYTATGYTIDRWYSRTAVTATLQDNGLRIRSDTNPQAFNQRLENFEQLLGQTVTVSMLITENRSTTNIEHFGLTYADNVGLNTNTFLSKTIPVGFVGLVTMTSVVPATPSHSGMNFALFYNNGTKNIDITVAAVKLELGSQQTLAHQDSSGNWVLNDPPPDKALELLKCQRYYQVFSSASIRPTKAVDFRPTMRIDPALSTIEIDGVTYYTADANL